MSAPTPAARRARTRTGCKTCRQRKLKCDEVKPVCGHCRKSNRECQPSEGVAFRHAQNAGFADRDGGNELGNFYKYRQKFSNTYFLPIPQELSFVHVTDPYEDETSTTSHSHVHHQHRNVQNDPSPSVSQYQHPQYVDVAATSLKAMIDPNLEAGTGGGPDGSGGISHDGMTTGGGPGGGVSDMSEAETLNETILNALKQSDATIR